MDGVLLVDKPAGPTSHDVVARIRRGLPRGVKVGHAGTLDPFATGLLLVLLGRATRVQRFLMDQPKAYETVARLGWTSTTGDPEGELVHTGRVPPAGAELPTGRIRQRPAGGRGAAAGGHRQAPAGLQRDQDRRPARLRAGPRRGGGRGARARRRGARVPRAVARGRPGRLRDRLLVGHLRALADRRPR